MIAPAAEEEIGVVRHMARGSMWMISVRWSLRLMGLISTVILARLLTPTDYGIVSLAAMVVGVVGILSEAGQQSALIRHPNPTREHYDAAWTIALIQGLGVALILWVAAPFGSSFFHEPRIEIVVRVLALRSVLWGAGNIGIVDLQRNLQFNRLFWYRVAPTLISFGITIVAAVVLRNYWALVISVMCEEAVSFVLGYWMASYRPRLGMKKLREIWGFSFWVLFTNMGVHFNTLVDRVAVGRFNGVAAMGRYDVATDLATTANEDLVGPMVATLFPVMAKVQNDRVKRRDLYLTALYWTALICTSTTIGVALVADDMVDLLLGPQWQDVKPLMPFIALAHGVLGLSTSVYTALDTIGQPKKSARLQWIRLIGLSLAIFPVAYYFRDLQTIAATRLAVTLLITPTLFYALMEPFDLHLRDILATLWRPWMAGALMAVVVLGINSIIPFTGPLRLFIDVALGAMTYIAALMILWALAGLPEGPERFVWDRLWLRRVPA